MIRELPIAYIERPPPPPPPPSSHTPKSNLPALYYGLVVVGAAAIILVIYNLIIIKWCTRRQRWRQQQQPRARRRPLNNGFVLEATTTTASDQSFDNIMNRNLLSSFKYNKRDMNINTVCQGQEGHYDDECAVCLSIFEEGEDVRQLPRCKHSFHASCIDMWLYSHFDCPLCRAPIQVTRCPQHLQVDSQSQEEHSRENLLASGTSQQTS